MNEKSEVFAEKHALLDVNILSEMARTKRAARFRPVFEFLQAHNVAVFLTDTTLFEFTGFAGNRIDYEFLASWIRRFPVVRIVEEDVERAALISSMYKCKNPGVSPKQISYADCLYAAQVIRYRGRAFIVTTNVNDYPVFLFDLSHTIPIEEDNGQIVFVGFITFNEEKWNLLNTYFQQTGPRTT